MDKEALVKAIQARREEIGGILEQLSDEQMCQPGLVDAWSVKDVITHLNMWEAELIQTLHQASHGAEPKTLVFNENFDEINQVWFDTNQNRELERALNDFDGIERQICRMVEEYDQQALFTPGHYLWLGNQSLAGLVEDICLHHEAHHLNDLRVWLGKAGLLQG